MSKYQSRERGSIPKPEIHPAWRGIGFLLILIIPVISYAAASVFIDVALAQGWTLPYELMGFPTFDPLVYTIPVVSGVAIWLANYNNFYILMLFTFLFMFVLGGVIGFVYSAMYRVFGPPRYSPLDEPAPKRRPGAKSR
jgi:hypothetical protein